MATPPLKRHRETLVGALFFAALGLLGFFTILIGDIPIFKSTWSFDILFDDVGGLETGQDVLYAGSKIGTVKGIITRTDKIVVRVEIQSDVKVYHDAAIVIEEKSALGGMRIAMTRGTPAGGIIRPDDVMIGKGLATLTTQIKEAAQKISRLADTATDTLSSVKEGKGSLGKLWTEDALYDDLRTAVSDIREAARNFRSVGEKIDQGQGILGEMVNNEESRENLRSILKSWKDISDKIVGGEGAVGDLVMNPETKKEVKETITKLKDVGDAFTKVRTFIGVNTVAVPDDHYSVSKIYLRLEPRPDRYYLIGGSFFSIQDRSPLSTPRTMEDDEYISKIDLQIAQRFMDNNRMTFRAGLLEGKPGAGLDYLTSVHKLPLMFSLEGRGSWDDSRIHEAYDPILLRLKADLTIFKHFHLIAGVNSLLERPAAMVGIGFEFQDQDLKYLVGTLGAR